jgi:hypothetical protein
MIVMHGDIDLTICAKDGTSERQATRDGPSKARQQLLPVMTFPKKPVKMAFQSIGDGGIIHGLISLIGVD